MPDEISSLSTAAKIIGIVVGLLTIITASSTAAIKLTGVETINAHRADIELLRAERDARLRPLQLELHYVSGMIDCQYQRIPYESCPAVKAKYEAHR